MCGMYLALVLKEKVACGAASVAAILLRIVNGVGR